MADSYTYDPYYDRLYALNSAPKGWHKVTNGGTNSSYTKNTYVSGTNLLGENSLFYQYNDPINNGIAVNGGSIAIIGSKGLLTGGTALYNASIEALGSGVISRGIVGSSGAIFAGGVTAKTYGAYVSGGGTALDPVVGSAGYALAGGGAADFVVKGYAVDGSGGLISGGTFNPGSLYGIGNGGTGSGGTIFGSQAVFSGGLSKDLLFTDSKAVQLVVSNGLSSRSTILGGTLLNSGGTTSGAVIKNGGTIRVAGGTYFSWLNANYQQVYGGYGLGSSYDDIISSGATELVYSDGAVTRSILSSGAQGTIFNGGTSLSPTIAGGTETVSSGGSLLNGAINNNGTVFVGSSGYVSGLSASRGYAEIQSGGVGSEFVANNGGTIQIDNGGSASHLTVNNGGTLSLLSGGSIINGATIIANSTDNVVFSSGGVVDYIVASGGTSVITSGATILNNTVYAVGSGTALLSGSGVSVGTALAGTDPNNSNARGGTVAISNGGAVSSATAQPAGAVILGSGGTIGGSLSIVGGTGSLMSGGLIDTSIPLQVSAGAVSVTAGSWWGAQTTTSAVGGYLYVDSGYSFKEIDLASQGTATINGAIVSGMSMASNAVNTITGGGTVLSITASGGTNSIGGTNSAGSKSIAFTLNATGGTNIVSSGGSIGTLSATGGTNNILAGATVTSLTASNATNSVSNTAVVGSLNATGGTNIVSSAAVLQLNATSATNILASKALVQDFNAIGGANTIASGARVLNTLSASQGASLSIASGATVMHVTLDSVNADIPQGGAGIQTLSAVNGATSIINSGANLNSVFLSSGNATVASGAFISRLTIMSGASGVLNSGASVQHIDVANGGWVSGARVANNSELAVSSGGTAIQTLVTYDSGTGQHVSSPYTMVQSGGTVSGATIAGAPDGAGTNNLGGLLTIASGAVLVDTSMGYNARIRVDGLKYSNSGSVSLKQGILTVSENGQTWQINLTGNYEANGFILNDDGNGNTIVVYQKCFLAGSMIRTPKGEKAVERLRKGEQICVFADGKEDVREITAVIQRRARVNTSQPEDMAGWSVIVAKDAFGEGLPNKDLSVTPEHCFYFEGRFVPARMLVNGTSIRYDHSQVEYDYYHVQTAPHSIIWANDVLTESWLDTDEEQLYKPESSSEDVLSLADRQQLNWNEHAAAPLDVSQAFVKPLHERLAARAVELGITKAETAADVSHDGMTADPAPYIRLEDGRTIRPQRHEAGRYIFSLPAHARRVILGSRTFRPSENIGPHMDDRRELGMLVGQVSVWAGGREYVMTRHLTEKHLKGWDVIEAGPHRWTQGEAELLLHDAPSANVGQNMVSIEVQAGGPYRQA
ncbi:Hint domain-containing protein [Acetobacteraceae bacterium B3987]|nr:Hint domain-containing protein [Acetobacteraceae bacterium B3987]